MKILKIVILLILIPSICLATPTINEVTGTVEDGESIVISGSSFGTKSPAAPLKFDDFSSGTDGSTISNGWGYDTDHTIPKYEDSDPRIAGDNYIQITYDADNSGHFFKESESSNRDTLYTTFYIRKTHVSGAADVNHKYCGFSHDVDDYAGANSLPRLLLEGVSTGLQIIATDDDGSTTTLASCYFSGGDVADSEWIRVEMFGKESSGGAATDGQLMGIRQNGEDEVFVEVSPGAYNLDAIKTRTTDHWRNVMYGLYCDRDGVYTYDFSDVYLDISWARVEIGDNATYESCTHREIQIPSAWATGEITVTVNQGSFAAEATAYVFVVDSDGSVSDSYGITIGGEAEGGIPGQVTLGSGTTTTLGSGTTVTIQ